MTFRNQHELVWKLLRELKRDRTRKAALASLRARRTKSMAPFQAGFEAMSISKGFRGPMKLEQLLAALYAEIDLAKGHCLSLSCPRNEGSELVKLGSVSRDSFTLDIFLTAEQCGHIYCKKCLPLDIPPPAKICDCFGCSKP